MDWDALNILALILLTAAVVVDLRTRKIPNNLVLASLILSVISVTYHLWSTSAYPWTEPFKAFGLATAIALLLFQFKVWGGGDAKMFIAVSPLLLFAEIPIYLLACLVWGSLMGLVYAALSSGLGAMFRNISTVLLHRQGIDQKHLVKVPFSVALLLGYLSLMTLQTAGAI